MLVSNPAVEPTPCMMSERPGASQGENSPAKSLSGMGDFVGRSLVAIQQRGDAKQPCRLTKLSGAGRATDKQRRNQMTAKRPRLPTDRHRGGSAACYSTLPVWDWCQGDGSFECVCKNDYPGSASARCPLILPSFTVPLWRAGRGRMPLI